MSDIVERLRSPEFSDVAAKYLMAEAASEIERLRSLLKEAGEALELIAGPDACKNSYEEECDYYQRARAVLSKIKGEA